MIPEAVWEQALRSPSPSVAIREKVTALAASATTKSEIYESLGQLVLRLRRDERVIEEEIVLDAMDSLTDWCHPDARLLPDDDSLAARGD
jgi:hypothetical protein